MLGCDGWPGERFEMFETVPTAKDVCVCVFVCCGVVGIYDFDCEPC